MSLQTEPDQSVENFANKDSNSVPFESNTSSSKPRSPKTVKRKKKLSSRMNMWIRRIHLFSGLFMLPWVLLYGFTALLFNHPTYMTDSKTEVEHFRLNEAQMNSLPSAELLAKQATESAQAQLSAEDSEQTIEIAENPNALFTRQVSGSLENDEQRVSVILDMNNGKGYLRKTTKEPKTDERAEQDDKVVSLKNGLKLELDSSPVDSFRNSVDELLSPLELEAKKLNLRSVPNVEFDAIVDGTPVRMRLTQDRSRSRQETPDNAKDKNSSTSKSTYRSQISIVGENPREMSARSFLLRLHMAHGYGIQTNSRWFWAIAVDLMFASMCFWGLSGVVMWWQIKRTRKIGFALLLASAIVATWLAIGMHWQLANG